MAPDPDEINLLVKKATKIIQSILGTVLYYSQSVDTTILQVINEILQVQSRPTRDTKETARMLLDYAATYPDEILRYKANYMVLHVDLDAAYFTMPEARSRCAGHFYLSNWPSLSPIKLNADINGPMHTNCKTIRNAVSSVSEAEACGTFNNGKT